MVTVHSYGQVSVQIYAIVICGLAGGGKCHAFPFVTDAVRRGHRSRLTGPDRDSRL